MRFFFDNTSYSLSEIINEKVNQKTVSKSVQSLLKFVRDWNDQIDEFQFRTSGTTGIPKRFTHARETLSYSVEVTMQHLFPNQPPSRLLLCLDPDRIGGKMVIVRALLTNADLHIVPPTANPLKDNQQVFDLVSMVPYQAQAILEESPEAFERVNTVLIGGAPLEESAIRKLRELNGTRFLQTYGMTETASHIAFKNINEDHYKTLGDIELGDDGRKCLKIKGTITQGKWLQTNDVVIIQERDKFKWIGRADLTINSGGVKIQPEEVELKISNHFPKSNAIITWREHPKLGQEVVLVCIESTLKRIERLNFLDRIELPGHEVVLEQIPFLESDKPNRVLIQKLAADN